MVRNFFKLLEVGSSKIIITTFKTLSEKDNSFKASVHQKKGEILNEFEVGKVLEDLWIKHYLQELNSNDQAAHVSYIKSFEKISNDFNRKGMEVEFISAKLIALYLSCKLPNSTSINEDMRGANIFNHYVSYGEINFNPPSKNRHIFLKKIN